MFNIHLVLRQYKRFFTLGDAEKKQHWFQNIPRGADAEKKQHWLEKRTDEDLVAYAGEANRVIEDLEDKIWITKHLRDDALWTLKKRGHYVMWNKKTGRIKIM